VLLNLMHNAIEAFALAKTPTPQLHIQTWQADKCLYLSCADNGPGVPAQAQSSIFDMQYSTKPNNLGVGLWLSRYIVERHGGKLWLDETADQGARFVARIPAA
jgi:signal transduction histidine kinase